MEKHRIYTLPNVITFFRFILAIFFIYYMILDEIKYALIIYTIAIASDSIDGFIARRYKQTSALGRKMDAFVDSILIISAFILLVFLKYIGLIMALVFILPRIITAIMLYVYSKKKFVTTKYAKLAAFFTYIAIILIIIESEINILYFCFALIYLFSILHWLVIIKENGKIIPKNLFKKPKFRMN